MEGKNLCRASDVNSPLKKLPTRFCSYLFKNRKKKAVHMTDTCLECT